MTKCDGIMIGRGAMGNPWIFSQVQSGINGEKVAYPSMEERINMCIEHYKRSLYYHNEDKAVREMRKHIGWYIKGLECNKEIKDKINYEKSSEKVIEILLNYKERLNNNK